MIRRPPAIEVHIEELVWSGFGDVEAASVKGAVERELSRVLARHRALETPSASGTYLSRIDGGDFVLHAPTSTAAVAKGVARLLSGALRSQEAPRRIDSTDQGTAPRNRRP